MNLRTTLKWLAVALVLLGAIVLLEKYKEPDARTAPGHFPKVDPAQVSMIRLRPGNGLEIRVVRTNGGWKLVQPIEWWAQDAAVGQFLSSIQKLAPSAYITPAELRQRAGADKEYGFDKPQTSIILEQASGGIHLLAGAMTAPGDQFFLQVVGDEGVYVCDADFLKLIPGSMNDWRDRSMVNLNKDHFDHVTVTNGPRVFTLQRTGGGPWRLSSPIRARADNARVHDALEKTHSLRIQQFVSDDPQEDLEQYGLQPAALALSLVSQSNSVLLQFGRLSGTNLVYARRGDWRTVATVQNDFVTDWQKSLNEFREPFLLSASQPVVAISCSGPAPFTLALQTNGWHISPSNWPGDAALAKEFIAALNSVPIEQFVNDVATAPDLPTYGLDSPSRIYELRFETSDAPTNNQLQLQFGATAEGRTFARRTDEDSVYAVPTARVEKLASAPWQLRQRRLWMITVDDVKKVKVSEGGQSRELLHKGDKSWALAPGTQGMINDLAVDETVRGIAAGSVDRWSAMGVEHLPEFGITGASSELVLELNDGQQLKAAFGKPTSTEGLHVAVVLDGMTWIGEYPWILCRDIAAYLAPPPKNNGQ